MNLLVTVLVFGIYSAALLAIGGVGFTLQFGVTNVLNLSYGAILTSCIFVEYALTSHSTDLWVAILVGAASGAVLSFLVGHVLIGAFVRRGASGFSIAMVTIGLSLVIQFGLEAIQGPFIFAYPASGASPVRIAGVDVSIEQLTTVGVAVVVMAAVHVLLKATKLGLAMRATAADSPLTRSCGVSPTRTRAVAWLFSGALCGICGIFLGIGEGAFLSSTGSDFFITLAAAAVLGGIGKPYGAMVGALVVGIASQAAAAVISPSYSSIAAWIILIAVLVVRPQGIFAELASQRELVA